MPRTTASPNCYVIAGPNGAGKTTFATRFLPVYANCGNFINADLMARAYSPFDPDAGMVRAGRAVLERIAESIKARKDFAFDNSSDEPRLIFKDETGKTDVSDLILYQELLRQSTR